MKMLPGHVGALKKAINEAIEPFGWDEVIKTYETGNFPRADKVKDLQKRFCFDLLFAANVKELVNEIYEYCNDDHIYAALKSFLPTITRS